MNVVSELRANVLTARAFLTLLVGAVIGALLIVCEISMAALIFSGPLAPILPQGIGMLVFGTFALYPPVKPCSSRRRSKMRFAVCRCLAQTARMWAKSTRGRRPGPMRRDAR